MPRSGATATPGTGEGLQNLCNLRATSRSAASSTTARRRPSRDGSEQIAHGSASVRAWQTEHERVRARASARAVVSAAVSYSGAARRWYASRRALLGPMPGSVSSAATSRANAGRPATFLSALRPVGPAVALHVGDLAAEEIHHPLHAFVGRDLHLEVLSLERLWVGDGRRRREIARGRGHALDGHFRALPEDGDRGLLEHLRHRGLGQALLGHDARRVERDENVLAFEPDRRVLEYGAEL